VPVVFGAGAGAGTASSSSSSSASLSELEEEEEEEEEDEEGEDSLDCFFCIFGASFISTSESLDSSSLLLELLSLSELLSLFRSCQLWKMSSSEGISFESALAIDFLDCSLARASLVLLKPD
jgi:hypothetical protein